MDKMTNLKTIKIISLAKSTDIINKRFINCCPTSRHKTTYTKIKC